MLPLLLYLTQSISQGGTAAFLRGCFLTAHVSVSQVHKGACTYVVDQRKGFLSCLSPSLSQTDSLRHKRALWPLFRWCRSAIINIHPADPDTSAVHCGRVIVLIRCGTNLNTNEVCWSVKRLEDNINVPISFKIKCSIFHVVLHTDISTKSWCRTAKRWLKWGLLLLVQ